MSIQDFRRASVDDICAVHERSYVLGLEKLTKSGRADIVDNAPTYITGTSFDDALRVRHIDPSVCCLVVQLGLPSECHALWST